MGQIHVFHAMDNWRDIVNEAILIVFKFGDFLDKQRH